MARQPAADRREAATAAATPLGAIKLSEKQRACYSCGVAVAYRTTAERNRDAREAALIASAGPTPGRFGGAARVKVVGAAGEFGVRPDPGWRNSALGRLAQTPLVASAASGASVALTLGHRVDHGPVIRRTVYGTLPAMLASTGNRLAPSKSVEFVRCARCMARADRAERLVRACPPTMRRHGVRNAVDWTTNAFDSLAYLGRPEPHLHDGPDATRALEADLETLIACHRGGAVAFASAIVFDPAIGKGGWPTDSATPRPWAHVTERGRATARDSYAASMAQRLALSKPPVKIKPSGASLGVNGCAMCGIGEQEVSALRVLRAGGVRLAESQVWGTVTVAPSSLGARGRSSVRSREMPVCRACRDAIDEAGGTGQRAIEKAVLAHLTASGGPSEVRGALLHPDREVSGLRGWAALFVDEYDRTGTARKPNDRPWQHLDLTRLKCPEMVTDPSWAMPAGAV